MSETLVATVTVASPLTVLVDGADTACPATAADDAPYSAGDRVIIAVRTPRVPLVTGQVETTA